MRMIKGTRDGVWCTSVCPALGKWRQRDPEFKVLLVYRENLRSAWATGDLALSDFFLRRKGRKEGRKKGKQAYNSVMINFSLFEVKCHSIVVLSVNNMLKNQENHSCVDIIYTTPRNIKG